MKLLRRILAITIITLLVGGFYLSTKGFLGFDPIQIDGKKVLSAVAGKSSIVLSQALGKQVPQPVAKVIPQEELKAPVLKVALLSDSHNDNTQLSKAVVQAKQAGATELFFLGDFTDVGTVKELREAKTVMDKAELPYLTIPGDHDLWDNKDKGKPATANFEQLFGKTYQVVDKGSVRFILVNNANNDFGLSPEQLTWLKQTLEETKQQQITCQQPAASPPEACPKSVFLLTHEPLFHPTTSHVMGRVQPKVDGQRKDLLQLLATYKIDEIITGDLHFFSQYKEPTTGMAMTTIGAVTDARNPQKPRFATLTVYEDNSYAIEDQEIVQ